MSTTNSCSVHQDSLKQFLKQCDDHENLDEQRFWQDKIFWSVEAYQKEVLDKNPVPNVSSKSFDSYIGNGPKPPSPYAKESCRSADGKLQSSSSGFNLSQCSEVLSMNDDDSSVNLIFKVQFKHNFKNYIRAVGETFPVTVGCFVIVKCRNGEDIGVVVEILTMPEFMSARAVTGLSQDDEENEVGLILRIASPQERKRLPGKLKRETKILKSAIDLAKAHHLPMVIIGAEYQFDSLKLTIHYTSEVHVDFRQFVRDLFLICRVRIWMKKINLCHPFTPYEFASIGLATGLTVDSTC